MQQKYKVLSFAIVAALYIFLVPSPSHAQTHVPNTFGGAKACLGTSWTLGCDRIPLNGQPGTAAVCERLEMTKPAYWSHTTYDIIQATGGYCYYYKDGKSSGRGGPNMWRYDANSAAAPPCADLTTGRAGNHTICHTPGETVGVAARPAISCGNPGYNCTHEECSDKLVDAMLGKKMACANTRSSSGVVWCRHSVNKVSKFHDKQKVGLGYVTRYIQSTGGYCYYYKSGTGGGKSGTNTWRYDPR